MAAIALTGNFAYSDFTPDITTMLALVVLPCIVWQRDIFRPLPTLALAAATAVAVAVRFPNVLAVPVIVAYYSLSAWIGRVGKSRAIWHFALYIVVAVLLYCVALASVTGSADIITTLAGSVAKTADSRHSIASLLSRYHQDINLTMTRLMWVVGAVLLPVVLGWTSRRSWRWQLVALLPLAALLAINRRDFYGGIMSWNSFLFLATVALMLVNARRCTRSRTAFYALVAALAMVSAAGSDTGFNKAVVVVWPFLPLVLIDFRRHYGFSVFSTGVLILFVVVATARWAHGVKELSPCSLFCYRGNVMLVSDNRRPQLTARLAAVERYGYQGHNLFFGMDGHEIAMLTDAPVPYPTSYWQELGDTIRETATIARLFRHDPSAVVFDYTRSPLLRRQITNVSPHRVMIRSEAFATVYRHRR